VENTPNCGHAAPASLAVTTCTTLHVGFDAHIGDRHSGQPEQDGRSISHDSRLFHRLIRSTASVEGP